MVALIPFDDNRVIVHLDGVDVWIDSDLSTECQCKQEPWCGHRTMMMAEQSDIDAVSVILSGINISRVISVPMVPSKNLFARVILETTSNRKAYTARIDPQWSNLGNLELFLGMIAPGDSLWTMRSIVYDWFEGHCDKTLECKSTSHSYKAQMLVKRILTTGDSAKKFEHYWTVFNTGNCITCNSQYNDDFADVIPEDEKRVSPWRSR